jgi:hypothetical protein
VKLAHVEYAVEDLLATIRMLNNRSTCPLGGLNSIFEVRCGYHRFE